ncbi:MAG: DNA polymerase IV [Longimicrobiales bacterium]
MSTVVDQTSERRILLVDCDAFFVQVARLNDPDGAGRARLLIVGGSPTGRGVVTSASYECRAYGVHSAMPTAHALRLCPEAMVVGVPRSAVVRKSREVRAVLEDLAPVVQAASIDEFYLDLSGTERLFATETLEATARRIREGVLARTQVEVSIGGGTGRVIAKLATAKAKPAGVCIVARGAERDFLDQLDLADLPGVGPALADVLRSRGLVRVRDAVAVQREWLERWLGTRRGAWLYRRVHGHDDGEVEPREARRSISAERTFFEDLGRDEDLDRRLLEISESVSSGLRKEGLNAKTVTVKLRDYDFRTRSRSRTLAEPVESDSGIRDVARVLLAELRSQRRVAVRLLGVALSGLSEGSATRQLGLFPEEPVAGESERDRTVSRTVDQLREKFGRVAGRPGRLLQDHDG